MMAERFSHLDMCSMADKNSKPASPKLDSFIPVEAGKDGPVTVTISRRVKPGFEDLYERWITDISAIARTYPGHMGVNVVRPAGDRKDYVIIFRFDSYVHLEAWENSEERARWVEKIADWVEGETTIQRVTGLEFWFTLPEVPVAKPPSPHKMALVVGFIVFCLVLLVSTVAGEWLSTLPLVARAAIVAVFQVTIMTYIIMPRVTRLLRPWLYGD